MADIMLIITKIEEITNEIKEILMANRDINVITNHRIIKVNNHRIIMVNNQGGVNIIRLVIKNRHINQMGTKRVKKMMKIRMEAIVRANISQRMKLALLGRSNMNAKANIQF